MSELQAIETAFTALDALTPEERQRAMRWLNSRITADIEKGWRSSYELGLFFVRAGVSPEGEAS
jgi:hypothetical protein